MNGNFLLSLVLNNFVNLAKAKYGFSDIKKFLPLDISRFLSTITELALVSDSRW